MKDIAKIKILIANNSLLYLPQAADNNISKIIANLRNLAKEEDIISSQVLIPDRCEKYGFAEGSHNLENLLLFLANMLEE